MQLGCPLCANSGLMRCGKLLYSITVSTRASSVGGTVMPSDFAVFILRLKSSFVDCSTGSASIGSEILSVRIAEQHQRIINTEGKRASGQ